MKNEKMSLWDQVKVTDPSAVKPITGKNYRGHSPNPYWIIQRATEIFGPCGIGWGVEIVNERFERFGESESLHIARVRVWYQLKGEPRGHIEQMGQTRSSYITSKGVFTVDEDAPKKSVTDGMVKCLSMLGFAGDIFSGQWDDSKYVAWAAEETERRESPALTPDQIEEITRRCNETGADLAALMKWVSKVAGREIAALKDVPAEAYQPIIKQLEKKAKVVS